MCACVRACVLAVDTSVQVRLMIGGGRNAFDDPVSIERHLRKRACDILGLDSVTVEYRQVSAVEYTAANSYVACVCVCVCSQERWASTAASTAARIAIP